MLWLFEKAVAAIEGEIGVVVQAAMGLDVCLFPSLQSFLSFFVSIPLS